MNRDALLFAVLALYGLIGMVALFLLWNDARLHRQPIFPPSIHAITP